MELKGPRVELNVNGLKNLSFLNTQPKQESLQEQVILGLSKGDKSIPSKYLYDKRGSELFDQICQQPEYYQTDSEMEILSANADKMLPDFGRTLLVEFGSGHSRKIRTLLPRLRSGSVYVPIDISKDYLLDHAERIARDFRDIHVSAVCADFLKPIKIPVDLKDFDQIVGFFPGSTIGNFEPPTQRRLLVNIFDILSGAGFLLVGVDKKNDPSVLRAAYNDAAGVTSAFEMNILVRLNRELSADFDLSKFHYHVFYNDKLGRVEMSVESRCSQTVSIGGHSFFFNKNEKIHLENSYKYSREEFASFIAQEGLEIAQGWTDRDEKFNVFRVVEIV